MTEHPLHDLAMQIRYDLTAAQGKITELLRQIGELDLPEPVERASFTNGPVLADLCESCGVGGDQHAYDCTALHYGLARARVVPAHEETGADFSGSVADLKSDGGFSGV